MIAMSRLLTGPHLTAALLSSTRRSSLAGVCSRCLHQLRRHSLRLQQSRQQSPRIQPIRGASGGGGGNAWIRQTEGVGGRFINEESSIMLYMSGLGIFMLGLAFAAVPLYRKFCQMTGTASNPLLARNESVEKVRAMQPQDDCKLTVYFTADTHSQLAWNFRPQQDKVHLVPGETVLVFYSAMNSTSDPVTGIATYTVNPYSAAQYFNKIQCFCFEEQRLNPGEEVDMPVFFYIDPEYVEDPRLRDVKQITLSYCFFEAKEGLNLPLPGYAGDAESVAAAATVAS